MQDLKVKKNRIFQKYISYTFKTTLEKHDSISKFYRIV